MTLALSTRLLDKLASQVRALPGPLWRGEIAAARGSTLTARGLERELTLGAKCHIVTQFGERVLAEVIGVGGEETILMPFGDASGVAAGSVIEYRQAPLTVRPSPEWLGRVINAMGEPIDGKGLLEEGAYAAPLNGSPPNAFQRRRLGAVIPTGVRAIDTFTPFCRGQRVGLFAGSGVGKSTLLSMIAQSSSADVNVIGLIGERGREVQEFIQRDLGEAGLARSVVVVSTSDESPLARRQAAHLTLAVAEDQRKRGAQVFCLLDSVTRFAHALREIALAGGEPPSARGYPPSVFSALAQLLERAGPGIYSQGDVTAAFTVLVDGDDHDEPIADAVRGILDGHIVLARKIAARGRYPAIDVLSSVSRSAPDCYAPGHAKIAGRARELLALYEDKEEIIRVGLYERGSDPDMDLAIDKYPQIEGFLAQARGEGAELKDAFETLRSIVECEAVSSEAPPRRPAPPAAAPVAADELEEDGPIIELSADAVSVE